MGWYTPTPVAPDLTRDLVTGWTMRAEGEHRLVPDGCVDVLWIGNGTAWVCGPETSGWSFRLPPGTEAAGLRFRPGRAGAVLGFDTAEVRDLRVPLEDVFGARAGREFVERAAEAADPAARLDVLQLQARRWLGAAPDDDPVVRTVARLLERDPANTVGTLAEETGLSERQLHRRCTAAFGYGPSTLRKILRLQRFLRLARAPGAPVDLAGLAVAAGYTDQPHLSHDCRAVAGASPRVLIGREPRTDVRSVHDEHAAGAAVSPV